MISKANQLKKTTVEDQD